MWHCLLSYCLTNLTAEETEVPRKPLAVQDLIYNQFSLHCDLNEAWAMEGKKEKSAVLMYLKYG